MLRLRKLTFRRRADVQQIIASLARAIDQIANDRRDRFPILVVLVIAPVVVHRHARFPRLGIGAAGNRLFRSAIVAHVAFADPIVDDDVRLQRADVFVKIVTALFRPSVFPLAVEPEDADRAIVGQQFLDLALHISRVAIHVGLARGPVVPRPALAPVGMMPVHDRIIEAELDSLLLTGRRQFFQRIARNGVALIPQSPKLERNMSKPS